MRSRGLCARQRCLAHAPQRARARFILRDRSASRGPARSRAPRMGDQRGFANKPGTLFQWRMERREGERECFPHRKIIFLPFFLSVFFFFFLVRGFERAIIAFAMQCNASFQFTTTDLNIIVSHCFFRPIIFKWITVYECAQKIIISFLFFFLN